MRPRPPSYSRLVVLRRLNASGRGCPRRWGVEVTGSAPSSSTRSTGESHADTRSDRGHRLRTGRPAAWAGRLSSRAVQRTNAGRKHHDHREQQQQGLGARREPCDRLHHVLGCDDQQCRPRLLREHDRMSNGGLLDASGRPTEPLPYPRSVPRSPTAPAEPVQLLECRPRYAQYVNLPLACTDPTPPAPARPTPRDYVDQWERYAHSTAASQLEGNSAATTPSARGARRRDRPASPVGPSTSGSELGSGPVQCTSSNDIESTALNPHDRDELQLRSMRLPSGRARQKDDPARSDLETGRAARRMRLAGQPDCPPFNSTVDCNSVPRQ